MGRWKYDNSGQLAWDENDTGPDQGTPTPEQQASRGQSSASSSPWYTPSTIVTSGPTYPSKDDPGYWTDPNRSDYSPTNPIWPSQSTDSSQPGYVDPNKPTPIDGGFNSGNDPTNWASLLGGTLPDSSVQLPPRTANPNLPPPPAEWPQDWKDLYNMTGGTGGINPPWLHPNAGGPVATSGQPAPAPSTGDAVPAGFDAAKWNDPTKSDPKYDAGHMKAQGMSDASIGAAIQAKYPDYKYLGGDKILGPDGHIYDFDFASKTGNGQPAWTDTGDPNHPTTGGATGGGMASLMGGLAGATGLSSAGGPAMNGLSGLFGSGDASNLYNILMQRAGQSLTPSAKDPIIANQVNAYGAQQQRSARDYIDSLAESRGPISNLQGEKRLAAEKVGQDIGGFQAALMGKEVDARRQEIQQALTGAMGFLTEEQRMALQRELEYLNMSQRAYEFDTNDEFRRSPLAS